MEKGAKFLAHAAVLHIHITVDFVSIPAMIFRKANIGYSHYSFLFLFIFYGIYKHLSDKPLLFILVSDNPNKNSVAVCLSPPSSVGI